MFGYPKQACLHLPTPVNYLSNLSERLGIELYIKRDDLTEFGLGGNKLRKLEYHIYDAKEKGATMLITVGGAQTNHGRLTAAIAAKNRMKCAVISMDDYPGELSSNMLLERIFGAHVVLHKADGTPIMDVVERVAEKYESQGERCYFIPMGGSNEIGALGYYECAQELKHEFKSGHVITALGSMGTYMGLFCGLHDSSLHLTGIQIMPYEEDILKYASNYFNTVKSAWKLDFNVTADDFDINEDYLYGGYNVPSKEVRDAIYDMARSEAIILDPCYTGKAYAALLDMIEQGKIKKGETVIFLHTGGFPGLYTPNHRKAFEEELIDGVTIL
ncbi:MAG: D-cysteine desulfhydrase family protein [Clostridia bacterium]|nr:D-cysteine desulfhydrase family protein [Lachnospiraceae bacterium]NCC00248.1 D-cysteine desulfhydrase family protein [Clostridia bacterium]NCD02272.1 D-cysteine desulfhydrase family protein [Clostridia bacterium]